MKVMENRIQISRLAILLAAAGTAAAVAPANAQLVDASPTKANGDYIAGTGIPGDNFLSDGSLGAAVFLKARGYKTPPDVGQIPGQAYLITGNTFINVTDQVGNLPGWSFDFQFSPRADDVAAGRNYTLSLDVDLDGSSLTSFFSAALPLFDADASPLNSWDDTDGYFTNPGPGSWSDDAIDYVFSQAWRPGFGFLNGAELAPGDYTINWSATADTGNPIGSLSAVARLIPPDTTALTLDAVDACLDASEGQLVVALNLSNPQALSAGAQAFLAFDTAMLDFVSADVADPRFLEILEDVDEPGGTIDYGVYADFLMGETGTTTSTTLATITFDIVGDYCEEAALVSFRANVPPTRVTEFGGTEILPYTADLGVTTKDSVAPTLAIPDDIVVNADAGLCTASLISNWPFDVSPPTSATQMPDTFYTDRYAPAAFESAFFDGDNRLRHGIDAADGPGSRPASFSSAFYNTQGNKYDINIPVGQTYSIDLYIPSDWANDVRRADLWSTTRDANGDISGYPIFGFVNNDPADALNTSPASTTPRFRLYTQDTDFDPSNGYTADWIDFGLPGGFVYDAWYTLETELTPHAYIHRLIDESDTVLLEVVDPITFGSVRTSDLIIQAYNFGETYDVHWDNLVLPPEGAVASDDCSTAAIAFERSDDALLGLNDPFPAGTTTVTWTATDDCGNTTVDTQLVTVNSANDLKVDVELVGVSVDVDRCITFELTPTGGGAPVVVSETLSFIAGSASTTIDVPCGDYECITARDELHTLRQTGDSFAVVGPAFVADFTVSSGDALRGGNFNDDEFIDILDFGTFIGQFGTDPGVPGGDTVCGTVGPDADASGNGMVDIADFTYVQTQFLDSSEPACPSMLLHAGQGRGQTAFDAILADAPVDSITVDQLLDQGMAELTTADLNADGVLDQYDIAAFLNGALPAHYADITGDGLVDLSDLQFMATAFNTGDLAADANRDGVLDLADIGFVIDRFGMRFVN